MLDSHWPLGILSKTPCLSSSQWLLCLCSIHFQCGEENAGQDPNTYTVLQFLER